MNVRTVSAASRRTVVTLVAALLVTGLVASTPASAAGRITIDSELGGARVSLHGPTTISVRGSGFQSIQGGFGGVYVLFGWVDDPSGGSWRPSAGGQTARDYLYVPDTEARDNQGYQRFVAFPGSSTSEAANGGELSADGTFSFDMVVPGPTFEARDRDGNVQSVDCRQVQCGVIAIGAHGVVNANNETFAPVEFVESGGGDTTSGGGGTSESPSVTTQEAAGDAAGTQTAPDEAAPQDDAPAGDDDGVTVDDAVEADADEVTEADEDDATEEIVEPGTATVGVEQTTIIAGRVLAFTGQGFAPGEQVVATLSAGVAAVGPITAGQFGEVAGALTLPADLRPGSHVLRLEGAGSGEAPEVTISVMADAANLATDEPADDGGLWTWLSIGAIVFGAMLLALIVTSLVTALVRRRRACKEARTAAETTGADDTDGTTGIDGAGDVPVVATPDPAGGRAPVSVSTGSVTVVEQDADLDTTAERLRPTHEQV